MKLTNSALAAFVIAAAASSGTAFVPTKGSPAFVTQHQRTSWASPLHSTTVKRQDEANVPLVNGAEYASASDTKPTPVSKRAVSAAEGRAVTASYLKQYVGQSGAAIVYSKLVENGVEVVNGYSGGAVLPLLDQFHPEHPRHTKEKPASIRWITNSNEASAGYIGEGYAKSQPLNSEHLPVGVVVATSGPGVTNLITPLQDGICDGVPMVVMCGQAATVAPEDAFQSAPAVALTEPCTKWSYQVRSAAEIPYVMDYAFYVARNGRPGPVFVDLPKDLQNQVLSEELIDGFVEMHLKDENNDKPSLLSLQERTRMHNNKSEKFQALHLGGQNGDGKGLPFQIVPHTDGSYKLEPVTETLPEDADNYSYHKDHHATGKIIYTGRDGVHTETVVREESLEEGTPLFEQMMKMILGAKRPIIIAGQGCNDSPEELKKVAESLQIPVTTTLHALGCFDERGPLALNMMGMHGHPTPNFLVQDADLILCIGSRFDDRITGRMSDFAPKALAAAKEGRGGIMHVDIRASEKDKQVKPTYFVHSTAKKFLKTVAKAVEKEDGLMERRHEQMADWLAKKKSLQEEFPVKVPPFPTTPEAPRRDGSVGPKTPMSAQSVISEMDRQLLKHDCIDDAIFTTGVGIHQMVAAQLITWTKSRQMLSSGSLGTMGVSLGYSIGAQLANPKKMVISVDGDGSFNMSFTELKTVAEEGIPVKLMILDNESQMMVEYWQKLFQGGRLLAVRNSVNPDYSMLASSFGIKSIYCDREEDLEEAMKEFLFADPGKPVLFHVSILRTPCLPLVAPGQPLDDMILEDKHREFDASAAPS